MRNAFSLFLFFLIASCNAQPDSPSKMKPDNFEKEITNNNTIQILDVRTSGEYMSGHIKNALQADWTNQPQFLDRITYVDKEKPVYIYCLVGSRSASAARWMRNNGYKKVVELEGGINAWKRDNKSVEGNNPTRQLTLQEFTQSIPGDKTVLVDIGAGWCPPCVKMAPVIEELRNNKDINFQFVNIDAGVHTNLMQALNVEPIPAFIIYKNGKEVWRKDGIVSKEEFLNNLK